MAIHIILLGPPGSGKGTQSQCLAEHLHIPQIAPGNMLRAAMANHTDLGKKVSAIVTSGSLVPDEIMIDLIKERIQQEDCTEGFILDGFPRTMAQANALNLSGITIDYVFEIIVSDQEVINRLSNRFVHLASGRSYHLLYNPPQTAGVDDITGEDLVQRIDDQEATVKQRLQVYYQQTEPLVNYYQKLAADSNFRTQYVKIDGHSSINNIAEKILSVLKN